MGAILTPGYLRWDGFKYVLDPGTFTPAGDLTGNAISQQVVGIETHPVPAPSGVNTFLNWSGTALAWTSASGSFAPGGDLSGTPTNQTVIGLQTNPVRAQVLGSSQDGYALTWHNAGPYWEALPLPPGFTAGHDLAGSSSSQTVIGIQGNPVPTPTGTNTVLTWSGSVFSWSGGGITQLTGDVTAGPGSGSQTAIVAAISGPGGAGGTVPLSDGVHDINFIALAGSGNNIFMAGGDGPSSGGTFQITGGSGTSGNSAGGTASVVGGSGHGNSPGGDAFLLPGFAPGIGGGHTPAGSKMFTQTQDGSGLVSPVVIALDMGTSGARRRVVALCLSIEPGGGPQVPTGDGVVYIANRGTAPSSAPTGGGVLYVEAGALKYMGSSGTITPIAPA